MKAIIQLIREQRGSQGLSAAGAALAAALIIAALLGGANVVGPSVDRAMSCAAAVLGGGGSCASGGTDSGSGDGPSLWDRFTDALGDAWDWFSDNVLSPIGNFFKDAWNWFSDNVLGPVGDFFKGVWNWLSEEHTWEWWRDSLNWLKEQGWLGTIAAGFLGFAADLLFGIGPDGKFRWGLVIFATATTILSFFGVGLLAKIPVLGKLFAGGGILARFGSWVKGLPFVQKLISSKFGQWLAKNGSNAIADLLQGKFGTWLTNAGRFLSKVPVLGPILLAIKDSKIVKTIGNYAWTFIKRGPAGLVGEVITTILKDVIKPRPGTFLHGVQKIFLRLREWSGVRNIIRWILNPTFPFF